MLIHTHPLLAYPYNCQNKFYDLSNESISVAMRDWTYQIINTRVPEITSKESNIHFDLINVSQHPLYHTLNRTKGNPILATSM